MSISELLFKQLAILCQIVPNYPYKFRTYLAYKIAQINVARGYRAIKEVYPKIFLDLDLGDWLQRLYYIKEFELSRFELLKNLVPKGGTFIDVGANIGLYSCIMANHVGSAGSIIAFEPMPASIKQLRRNINLNKLNNIVVEPVALSNHVGELNLYVPSLEYTEGSSSAAQVWNPGNWKNIGTVPVNTLDSLFQGKQLDFIKIDIQGSELEALEGASKIIGSFQPIILCEIDKRHITDVLELVKSWNYKIFVETNNGDLSNVDSAQFLETGDYFLIPSQKVNNFI